MRALLPLLLLLAAAAQACSESPGGQPNPPGADAGSSSLPDAADLPGDAGPADAGAADGGLADGGAPDSGAPDSGGPDGGPALKTCTLQPPVLLGGAGELRNLYGLQLTASKAVLAAGVVTASRSERHLVVIDRSDGRQTLTPLTSLNPAVPVDLASSGTSLLVPLTDETRPATVVSWASEAGVLGASGSNPGRSSQAAVADAMGGWVLAQLKVTTAPGPLVVDRYDSNATAGTSVQVATPRRLVNQWDLDQASGPAWVCGYSTSGADEVLTLFEVQGTQSTPRPSTHKLGGDPPTGDARFGCRVAAGEHFTAVALSESVAQPRLVWLDGTGAVTQGPVPFLQAVTNARAFDVAVAGEATALAFVDQGKVVVQIFPTPGSPPLELRADQGAVTGAFTASRVRLARVGSDTFGVAFDASVATNRTDLVFREIRCTP